MTFVLEHPEIFFLVFARIFALVLSAPLLGSRSVPLVIKFALASLVAYIVAPGVEIGGKFGCGFLFLLAGEAAIGLVLGFFLQMIYMALKWAACAVADVAEFGVPWAEGGSAAVKLFDIAAISVFVSVQGLFKVFYLGVGASFKSITASEIALCREGMLALLAGGFSDMFRQAAVMAMPIVAVVLVVLLSAALVARISVQIAIFSGIQGIFSAVGVLAVALLLPSVMNVFGHFIDAGFYAVSKFLAAGAAV